MWPDAGMGFKQGYQRSLLMRRALAAMLPVRGFACAFIQAVDAVAV
jgi:hypothetical protein